MAERDLPFVAAVYASTREEELAPTGWPVEQKCAFLAHQHAAQHSHYQRHYPGAEWLVIEERGEPVGRLYLVEWETEFRIIDISLLPAARGRGLGGAILSDLLSAARAAGKTVSIHVERNNPAGRLYERLGFRQAEDKGVYLLMEWTPGAGGP